MLFALRAHVPEAFFSGDQGIGEIAFMAANLLQLYQLVQSLPDEAEAGLLKDFSRAVFAKATPEFMSELTAHDLLAAARGALQFLRHRPPGKVLVRVYNPSAADHGWESPHTVVEVALRDRPFVYDSLRASISGQGLKLKHALHPILGIRRQNGEMLPELEKVSRDNAEAYELFLVGRIDDSGRLKELEDTLRRVMGDVVLSTDDYSAMKQKTVEIRDYLVDLGLRLHQLNTVDGVADINEYSDFMSWLEDDNFVFLGYREYQIGDYGGTRAMRVVPDSALGILRKLDTSTYHDPVPMASIPEVIRKRITDGPILLVTKSNSESTVHRRARMDYIGIKQFDQSGQPAGERRFLGLFTSKAHSAPVDRIPILRRKLKQVLSLDNTIEGSHDDKQMQAIFNSMPREELFWSASEQLHRDIRTIMALEQERGVRVTVRPDPLGRGLALMVIMPRENFNTEVRLKIQELLTHKLRATHVDYYLAMGEDEAQIRFHFFFTTSVPFSDLDLGSIDREVAELARSWGDQLREGLAKDFDPPAANELSVRYAAAFGGSYKAETTPQQAIQDIRNLEALGDSPFLADLVNPVAAGQACPATHLKIYHQQGSLVLSDVFPFLENLGLKVIEQISHPVGSRSGRLRGIDIFRVVNEEGKPLDGGAHRGPLLEATLELLNHRAENDRLNRLVLGAGLRIREVALLRAYRGYLTQLQAALSRSFITDTMIHHPESARCLYRYFEARFGPNEGNRKARVAAAEEAFRESLNRVTSLPADNTLRDLFHLIAATVRTNFWSGKPYISFKVRSAAVKTMPDPRPLFEIVVSGPDLEGIHLRGGRVARGGLRWSERPDDFRTEVLGLMKTQMTKNAVIVPVGSKGGFVISGAPAEREALQAFVRAQYKTFVKGLLDLTDNIVGGKTIHPPDLVIYDEPDPYLVVAADKGTATFSDIANGISAEYGFWLGDAFASGGSHGYDHKKEGITARGAWECVSRHFREIGVNVKEQEFTAVGIGDMSGDVFGNGLLYTDKIKLLAAFNHEHIFVDPNPDPKRGFQERSRLFNLARSTWDDYDRGAISAGGGVFRRQAKAIPISPEIKAMVGLTEDSVSGQALIREILKMKVDLLWNGGVGTYVKASAERNTDVRDAANDGVRIDADQLQARVVGEGGNLGFTQLARIEYCLAGGRMNTDAIDNSAGVDMSDHEVNIKILLQPLLKSEELPLEQRNILLKEMTDEVSRLVLQDNYGQSLCLSLAQRASRRETRLFQSLLDQLVETERLRVDVENLPSPKVFEERIRNEAGLTRPELAILLAYTKMGLTRSLLETELPDEEHLQRHLLEYFPEALRERFPEAMQSHPLKREIVACQLTNQVVDRLGIAFLHGSARDTGASTQEVCRATLAALAILELRGVWDPIFALDNKISAERQLDALEEIVKAVSAVVQWILLADVDLTDFSELVQTYQDPLLRLRTGLEVFLPPAERERFNGNRKKWMEAGFGQDLATELTAMEYLTSVMGVIDVAYNTGVSVEEAARHFYAVGDRLSLGWLRDSLADLGKKTDWEKMAVSGLIMDLRRVQRQLTQAYVGAERKTEITVELFLSRHQRILKRFDDALDRIRADHDLTLVSGSVLTRLLAQLSEKSVHG